jgi:caa(3)-type oxidase subunit IV
MTADIATHREPGIWSVKKVFLWLVVLTVVEVGVTYVLSGTPLAVILILGALWKAALVGLHFMHLKVERRLVYFMLVSATILGVIFVLGLVPDLVYGPGAPRAQGL